MTLGQKLAVGFGTMVLIALVCSAAALYELGEVVEQERELDQVADNLAQVAELRAAIDEEEVSVLEFFITGDERLIAQARSEEATREQKLTRLRTQLGASTGGPALLAEVERAAIDLKPALDRSIAARRALGADAALQRALGSDFTPSVARMRSALEHLTELQEQRFEAGRTRSVSGAARARAVMGVVATLALLVGVVFAVVLSRTLSRQVGAAIANIQSSSAELLAAATEQATASTEQSSATNEITTTMRELLATSRQIAESAQRVARIAQETSQSAGAGDQSVQGAREALAQIRRQVDVVVKHMLDLGRKSQQIGSILEVINELAEQTNILAINATIESAGAGDAGKRFAVVAEEIRKLADRVSGSARDIRALIDEIRSAANTTVMATEDGSKSVDLGLNQFDGVASGLKRIGELVRTTSEAAREIELSTKQQSTAVEQVEVAMQNVAQASRETEANAKQTSQTSSELAALSKQLTRLIRTEASA